MEEVCRRGESQRDGVGDSPRGDTTSYGALLDLAGESLGADPGGYRRGVLDLVAKARAQTRL